MSRMSASDQAVTETAPTSNNHDDSFSLLRGMPLLAGLPEAVVKHLSLGTGQITCAPGDVICREGDPGESMYIVERGTVDIVVQLNNGEEVVVTKLGPGEFFGELALLDGQPRSATARAAAPAYVRTVSREQFLNVLREPGAIENLLLVLSQRLRAADKLLAERASGK